MFYFSHKVIRLSAKSKESSHALKQMIEEKAEVSQTILSKEIDTNIASYIASLNLFTKKAKTTT